MFGDYMPHREIMCGHAIAHLFDLVHLLLPLLPRLLIFENNTVFHLRYSLHSLLSVD